MADQNPTPVKVKRVAAKASKTKREYGLGSAKKKISLNDNKENVFVNSQQQVKQEQIHHVQYQEPQFMSAVHLKPEKMLIMEKRYNLDETKWIAVGIDPTTKNFDIVVRLVSFKRLNGIQMNIEEFNNLMNLQTIILNYLTDAHMQYDNCKIGDIEIYFHYVDNLKTITIIQDKEEQHFGINAMKCFFNSLYLISYYANTLISLNFGFFFENIVKKAFHLSGGGNDTTNFIDYLITVENVLSCLGIKEIQLYYPEILTEFIINKTIENMV